MKRKTQHKIRQPSATPTGQSYRRNATRAGDSVAANDSSISERHHAHKLRHIRRRLLRWFGVAFFVSIAGLIFMSQYSGHLAVRIDGSRANTDDAKRYETIVREYLAGRPAEHFRFLVHQPALDSYMREYAPEVASVRIGAGEGVDVLGSSTLHIRLRHPVALWKPDATTAWYVDNRGVLFQRYKGDEAPQVTITDRSGVPSREGEVIVSQGFLGFVGTFVGELEQRSLKATRVVIAPGKTRELWVHIKDLDYYVKATTTRSAYHQAEDTSRVVRYLQSEDKKTPQYIDVRVAGKAYYR